MLTTNNTHANKQTKCFKTIHSVKKALRQKSIAHIAIKLTLIRECYVSCMYIWWVRKINDQFQLIKLIFFCGITRDPNQIKHKYMVSRKPYNK